LWADACQIEVRSPMVWKSIFHKGLVSQQPFPSNPNIAWDERVTSWSYLGKSGIFY